MKELITTQLIAEYQKKVKAGEMFLAAPSGISELAINLAKENNRNYESFISRLQSKQSEERQNIATTFSKGIQHASGMEQESMEAANFYLKETFKPI